MGLKETVKRLEQQSGIGQVSGDACACPVRQYETRVILPSADGGRRETKPEAALICETCGKPQNGITVVVLPGGKTSAGVSERAL